MGKYHCYFIFAFIVLSFFKTEKNFAQHGPHRDFNSIIIDTIFTDKISIRAILPDSDLLWYAADKGRYGFVDLATKERTQLLIDKDSIKTEFRSIAQTSKYIFLLNAGNPALLYRISKKTSEKELVYKESHEKVFYDSMHFKNDKEGIAIGDPIADCFSIITTRDGGDTWQKISCDKLPKTVAGEAAFAASNSNIVIKGNKTWIASGGKKARIFYSYDNWKSWKVSETPIVQGEAMTGIFTADFYDEKNGFIAGGNYEIQNRNFGNKAITSDGGKSWRTIAENHGFGYASCIQYVPGSSGMQLVTVGGFGLQYSCDSGATWSQISDDKDLYTIRFVNGTTAVAAGKNKIVRIRFIE